jgi:hypothetical protein
MITRTQLFFAFSAAAVMTIGVAPHTVSAQASAKPTVRPAASPAASAAADSATRVTRGEATAPSINIEREIYSYAGLGRRDPYESLMATGELRPLVSDLRLTAVAFDPVGRNSVAILRDLTSQVQYRVRVGQTLGRLRVSGIRQKAVIFSIDEFGFSRQETLPLTSDSTTTRTR